MRNLFDCPFFECVRETLRNSGSPAPETLMVFYSDFSAALTECAEKEDSLLSKFRYLRLLHIEISSSYNYIKENKLKDASQLVMVLWKARERVEVELDIVNLKIGQFGIATQEPDAGNDAPVYWSKEYTVSDLMELILSLHQSGALVYRDGSRVSVAALTRLFERTFNVAVKDARGVKSNVTGRKIKATKFLDVLSANFIELCGR